MPYYAECYNEVVRRISQRPVVPVFAPPMRAVDLSGFGQHPSIGQVYDPASNTFGAALPAPKRVYTLAEWIDAMTDAELDVILDYVSGDAGTANQKRAARRVWEYWRANNRVDFNRAKNVQVLAWLVANSGGVWAAQRATELAG